MATHTGNAEQGRVHTAVVTAVADDGAAAGWPGERVIRYEMADGSWAWVPGTASVGDTIAVDVAVDWAEDLGNGDDQHTWCMTCDALDEDCTCYDDADDDGCAGCGSDRRHGPDGECPADEEGA